MATLAREPNEYSLLTEKLITSPRSLILVLIALICLFTRVRTGIQYRQQLTSKAEAKEIAVVPYWLPWLGHLIPFSTRFEDYLFDVSRSTKDGVFRLQIAGTVHNIVTSPSVTKQIYLQRSTVTTRELAYWIMENFFGDNGKTRAMDPDIIFGKPHQVIAQLNRNPFVSDGAANTAKLVEERTQNLISFSHSWVDQSLWERAGNVAVDPSGNSAEASFLPLIRYFVGDIACGLLMGKDFMTNNPDVLTDIFTLDASFQKLLLCLPRWFPGMGPAYRARNRLNQAVREHHQALFALWEDRDPGTRWDDMSDVSNVIRERAREFHNIHADPDLYGSGDVSLLWAMNVNANQIVFWMLWYVYQRPELRADLMQELRPYVTLTALKSDLPIAEPPKLTINPEALVRECPLLKATFYETLRLEAGGISYKYVSESFTVTESMEDAVIEGKSQPQTYKFPKGSNICVANRVHVLDGRYFKDPMIFNPRRFFVGNEKDPSRVSMDTGVSHPWGGGASMCKGRNFAEREVLIFVAAVLTVWDVEPVGGKWIDPGRIMASGAYLPKKDVRVRLTRRGPQS